MAASTLAAWAAATAAALALLAVPSVVAGGTHRRGRPVGRGVRQTVASYTDSHMRESHGVDEYSLPTFFRLHDLDNDMKLNRRELAALYGGHGVDVDIDTVDRVVVSSMLARFDKDGDAMLSLTEYMAAVESNELADPSNFQPDASAAAKSPPEGEASQAEANRQGHYAAGRRKVDKVASYAQQPPAPVPSKFQKRDG